MVHEVCRSRLGGLAVGLAGVGWGRLGSAKLLTLHPADIAPVEITRSWDKLLLIKYQPIPRNAHFTITPRGTK